MRVIVCMAAGFKRCPGCGIVKSLDEYHKSNNSGGGGVQGRCKPCKLAQRAEWGKRNKARQLEYSRRPDQRQRVAAWGKLNQDRKNAQQRQRAKSDPQKRRDSERRYREKNREKWLQKKRRYVKSHPERVAFNGRVYTGARRQAAVAWADPAAMASIYAEAARLRQITGQDWHVDHVVPLKGALVCGLHNEFNLRVILARENKSKGNKLIAELAEAVPELAL